MTATDFLITKLVLDESGFTSAAARVKQVVGGIASDLGQLMKIVDQQGGGAFSAFFADPQVAAAGLAASIGAAVVAIYDFSSAIYGLMPLLTVLGGGMLQVSFLAASMPFIKAAGELESLRLGLVSLTGDANTAGIVLDNLKKVALLPGIGFEGANRGFLGLFGAGVGASNAISALKEFGNALALAGKGRDDFMAVQLALMEIASKGYPAAQQVNRMLALRIPSLNIAIHGAFGTGDLEAIRKSGVTGVQFIERITQELAKMPRAVSGIKNTFENLADIIQRVMAGIGDGIARVVMPQMEKLQSFLSWIASSDALKNIGAGFAGIFFPGNHEENYPGKKADDMGLTYFAAVLVSTFEQIPTIFNVVVGVFNELLANTKSFIIALMKPQAVIANAFVTSANAMQDIAAVLTYGAIPYVKLNEGRFEITDLEYQLKSLLNNPISQITGLLSSTILGRADALIESWGRHKGDKPGAIPDSIDHDRAQSANALQQIQKNTWLTAEHTKPDYGKHIFGGGELGRLGVGVNEINGVRGYRATSARAAERKLIDAIMELMSEHSMSASLSPARMA